MSKNIVFEGWLTKSPPSKRIWRTKWRRRWFALRQSGELPGQYFLDYYADRNCRRLKGTINLDFCEQVDAGLHMERGSHSALDPTLRGSVFTIQTQTRTYHLEADCEADMERWVDAICRVCGLRPTDDASNAAEIYQNHSVTVNNQENIALRVVNKNRARRTATSRSAYNVPSNTVSGKRVQQRPLMLNASTMTNDNEGAVSTGPYIPISECITGVRAQDIQNFDSKNRVVSPKKRYDNNKRRIFRQPQIKINDVIISDTESNLSEEGCSSLNASQPNNGDGKVAKTFTKLSLAPRKNNSVSEDGPPVPPRPPKTLSTDQGVSQTKYLQTHQHSIGPPELPERSQQWLSVPRLSSRRHTPPSPRCSVLSHSVLQTDDEDETLVGHSSHYCNLVPLPPAVDRALKPRLSSHSLAAASTTLGPVVKAEEPKSDKLQYVTLDLPPCSTPSTSNSHDVRKSSIEQGNSPSSDLDCAYKTVDFVKTEAFNSTREDAEASRINMT